MALSAPVFNPFSSGVHRLNYSGAGRNSRGASDQRLASPTRSHNAGALTTSIVRESRSSGLAVGGKLRCRQRRRGSFVVFAADNSGNRSGETETTSSEADVEALEARLGVGRRARKQQQQAGGDGPQSKSKPEPAKPKGPKKTWDSMSFQEKAWSLYIDPEKGVLFWLNKLAYGAIYTIIGAWIVFRFIGPALGWYELDQPLLAPDRLLDGG